MRRHQQNGFVRFFLRAIDIFAAFYIRRPVHWDEEPFEKATTTQWRLGWFFVACMPIVMTTVMAGDVDQSFLFLAGTKGHPVVWLYVAFIGSVLVGGFCWLKIGPKIPLCISIPVAAVSWAVCLYVGWHPERFIRHY